MNPFISFCLYVSARVFVQYLKSRPKDTQIRSSLQFLLQAMQAIKRRNPLTESFLVQLDVDLEGAGIEDTSSLRAPLQSKSPVEASRSEGCPMGHVHLDHRPTYGNNGLNAYNEPNGNPSLASTYAPQQQPIINYTDTTEMSTESLNFMSMGDTFDLPNRPAGQSPNSNPSASSNIQRSPQSYGSNMDITPDTSSGEHLTPNSNTQQHHSSTSTYSPKNLWQTDNTSTGISTSDSARLTGMMSANTTSNPFSDFDMQNFTHNRPQETHGIAFPNWGDGTSTGLTPGPTGLTPAATGMTPQAGMADMLNMSDAEWNQMMENMQFQGWEPGVEHAQMLVNGREFR
jgi:hypothetical protein